LRRRSNRTRPLLVVGALMASALAWSAVPQGPSAPTPSLPPLERFVVGDTAATTPDPVQPGLLLMGGGVHDPDAMRWFLARAGHGHIVVLRASMTTDVADEIYRELHGAVSVETFVFHARSAAHDPHMLQSLAQADGVFIAGGDQSRYVKFWKHTDVARLLDEHVARGKPVAGTSAGLAIMGEYVFSAMTPADVTTDLALNHPTSRDVTIDTDFLHFDVLKNYITDSHFDRRNRLGRLVAFVTRANQLAAKADTPVEGLGVDETTSLAVLPDGSAHVFSMNPALGTTWLHGIRGHTYGRAPLDTGALWVTELGVQSDFNLRTHAAEQPLTERVVRVIDGQVHPR
jgi:L-asparaginase / beta-aspartyl-peptidase